MIPIELLLSARLFISPVVWGERLFFLSNLGQGGFLSLYAMDLGGSVPEPLLPPQIALQNPDLVDGAVFVVFGKLNKILLMLDQNGDENYQPMFIPVEGACPFRSLARPSRITGYIVPSTIPTVTWFISMPSQIHNR